MEHYRENLLTQIAFSTEYGFTLARLFKRLSVALTVVSTLTLVAFLVLQSDSTVASVFPVLTVYIALIITTLSTLPKYSHQCEAMAMRWSSLFREAPKMHDDKLAFEVQTLLCCSESCPKVTSLVNPIFNATLPRLLGPERAEYARQPVTSLGKLLYSLV